MSRQESGGATRRARRDLERAARVRTIVLRRFAAGSVIWVLAVVTTATLATWAIRSAGSHLGGNNLSLPEVSTSLAPAQGQVPELSAGDYSAVENASPSGSVSPSEPAGASAGSSTSRTAGRSGGTTTTSVAAAAATTGGAVVMPQATTPTTSTTGATTTAAPTTTTSTTTTAPSPHTHAPTTTSATPTPTTTTTAIVAPSPTASSVVASKETEGGTVTATCTGTSVSATTAPQDGWIEVAPVVESDVLRTGFHRNPRTVVVQVTCVKGVPEFAVSG